MLSAGRLSWPGFNIFSSGISYGKLGKAFAQVLHSVWWGQTRSRLPTINGSDVPWPHGKSLALSKTLKKVMNRLFRSRNLFTRTFIPCQVTVQAHCLPY